MRKPKKITIRETITEIDDYSKAEDVIETIQEAINAGTHFNIHIENEEYNYSYDPSDYHRMILVGHREETDEEYNIRITKEKEDKERFRQNQFAQLERLKKELGVD